MGQNKGIQSYRTFTVTGPCAQWKNSNFRNFFWMMRTQSISLLKLILFYQNCSLMCRKIVFCQAFCVFASKLLSRVSAWSQGKQSVGLKSVYFKKTVTRSSFLSKSLSSSIWHQLTLFWFSSCCIENDNDFERNEDQSRASAYWLKSCRKLT